MMTDSTDLTPPNSLREKLAQLMFVRIGSNLPPVLTVEEDAQRIERLLPECPVGGLLLFNGRREQTPETLARLQEISTSPLLVASDIERGVGQQVHGHALFPHAMGFAALGDDAEQTVHRFARLTAVVARSCGIHIAMAPVADVNVDPKNPIIATRAFGSDAERVAELVSAYVSGCREGGLLATAKHFPGHGNTHEDSHHALPTVHTTRQEMESCEFAPFRAAIDADVPLLMTAHVRYPHLDESGKCATLSQPILTDLLRKELGFQGVVVSDSLLMEGVKSQCANEAELAVEALLAGVDLLLDVADPLPTLSALEQAVTKGILAEQRVDEALDRLWNLKRAVFIDTASAGQTGDSKPDVLLESDELVTDVAARSITCLARDKSVEPFARDKSLFAVLLRTHTSRLDPPEQPLASALRAEFPQCDYRELGPDCDSDEFTRTVELAAGADQVLVAMIVKPAAWHRFGLLPLQSKFVTQLTRTCSCVLVSLGTPEALDEFDDASRRICTYSDVPASQRALAHHLPIM